MPVPSLYPDPPPWSSLALAASNGHVLQVRQSGRPDGIPALVLHGGPGSGCSPLLRRFFDPARYRVICIDQRGAGESRPRGATEHNTTADLLQDLRTLRERLDVARWLVVGGSWGAALALAHAAAEPDAMAGLLLRAVFLARAEDIGGFFQDAGADPTAWAAFAAIAPVSERSRLLAFLARILAQGPAAERERAALAWWRWEQALAGSRAAEAPQGDALAALVDRYRVQSHYLVHRCWLDEPPLLERCAALPRVPTLLLHGSEDRICKPEAARAILARVPHAELKWVADAGHDPAHPAMAAAMVEVLDHYAEYGRFGATER